MPVELSLVILAHNGLELTQRCVDSLETTTESEHQLILVDNGSTDGTAEWMRSSRHQSVLHEENLGFAPGMNSGLAVAEGAFVAFINNDTVFPSRWDRSVLSVFETHPTAGIVAPAVTAAGNPATVRTSPGSGVRVFEPFGHLPSGVVYVMRTEQMRVLGGWNEDYLVATGEDLDLLWTVWVNGLEVVLDERVLVDHVSEATRRARPDMEAIRKRNLEQFLVRWETSAPRPTRLEECRHEDFESNLRHAATGAIWLRRLVEARAFAEEQKVGASQPREQLTPKGPQKKAWWRRL